MLANATFGIQASGQFPDGMPESGYFHELARTVEELGYGSLWTGDHVSYNHPIHDIVVASSFLAAWTEQVTIGLGVMLLPLRHPALVAKEVASLDALSRGRVILGVGVGGESAADFRAVGVPIAQRGVRLDEGIDAVRTLWRDRRASHAGRHYPFRDITIAPGPATPGGPPVWIGGRSPRALARVGRSGDGWLAYMVSPERLRKGIEAASEAGLAVGRLPSALTFGVLLPTYVDQEDADRASRIARQHLAARYDTEISEHVIDKYCLVGTPERCRRRLDDYVAAGASHVVFAPVGPPESVLDQVKLLRTEVIA